MKQANEPYPTNVFPAPTSSERPNWPGGMWRVSDVLHRLAKSERLISLYFIRVNGPEWKHHSDDPSPYADLGETVLLLADDTKCQSLAKFELSTKRGGMPPSGGNRKSMTRWDIGQM